MFPPHENKKLNYNKSGGNQLNSSIKYSTLNPSIYSNYNNNINNNNNNTNNNYFVPYYSGYPVLTTQQHHVPTPPPPPPPPPPPYYIHFTNDDFYHSRYSTPHHISSNPLYRIPNDFKGSLINDPQLLPRKSTPPPQSLSPLFENKQPTPYPIQSPSTLSPNLNSNIKYLENISLEDNSSSPNISSCSTPPILSPSLRSSLTDQPIPSRSNTPNNSTTSTFSLSPLNSQENLSNLLNDMAIGCREIEVGNSNKTILLSEMLNKAETLVKTIKKLKKTKLNPPTITTIIKKNKSPSTTSTISTPSSPQNTEKSSSSTTIIDKAQFTKYRPRRNRKSNSIIKNSEDISCSQCGSISTPEWRKGPDNKKSLCNACGLYYAKSKKKENELSNQPIKHMSINNLINNNQTDQ
ncbi:putative GATA-binding transcription factor [Tieghemostelium lacteum]|uniref:Putative GATA-binding transcription factor n=1 Tax=Tieghemostelium lacteum TaxID=361077 RepID=A0A151Z4R4_TIELA|nr:putative GATA-binding transcription factor [Tieghemostelium lacteum]|eukprot:KYQ88931.1 putative GATA-binding transcription factor [Tieghemostelium lacteum]